jgi:Glycosyl transferase family 2
LHQRKQIEHIVVSVSDAITIMLKKKRGGCRGGRLLLVLAVAFLIIVFVATNMRLLRHFSSSASSYIIDDGKQQISNGISISRSETTTSLVHVTLQNAKSHHNGGRERRRRWKQLRAGDIELRRESVLPNNATTFSACLLIRDDNDLLPEWLAYHYHALNLRHLIVATDPLSSESPSDIFATWREHSEMKDILEWTDVDYMPRGFMDSGRVPKKYAQTQEDFKIPMSQQAMAEVSVHRYRQRVFLAKCMRALKKRSSTNAADISWLMHIDTDEFVVASKLLRENKPSYIQQYLPNLSQPNSVLHFIQAVARETTRQINYPCMSVLRVLFGSLERGPASVEGQQQQRLHNNAPSIFNETTFETLRFQYHAPPENETIRGNPKVIMDIAAMPAEYFEFNDDEKDDAAALVYSIHRPFANFCRKNSQLQYEEFRKQPIAVNHYLGSWERYAGRKNDKRRSRLVYDGKANLATIPDRPTDAAAADTTVIGNWLAGFIATVGTDTAAKLLGKAHLVSSI